MGSYLLLIYLLQLLGHSSANIIDSDWMEGECRGSVKLYEGSKETLVTKDENVKVTLDRVILEGCGCYTLHSKKNWKGRSFSMDKSGEYTGGEIGWSKVRSVKRVPCDTLAMPVWAVIIIVLVLVVAVALGTVFGFRKYREYTNEKTQNDA